MSDTFNPMHCSMPGFPVHYQVLELAQTHVHQVSDAISSSVIPFSSCLQSFPASGSLPMDQFFHQCFIVFYIYVFCFFQFSSVHFSRSVVSDSLRPHESQHTRLPVHHQLPEFTQTHVHRVSDAIQPSHPLSSPSPPAPNPSQHQSFPVSQLFA